MRLASAIAVYFLIWWACLFVILPWGVRNAHEAGESIGEGHEAGAPVAPMLWRKAAATTILATLVYGLLYTAIAQGWITFG
ncbi:MAG: DUF1467 family protein [Aestuariivirga sp.]